MKKSKHRHLISTMAIILVLSVASIIVQMRQRYEPVIIGADYPPQEECEDTPHAEAPPQTTDFILPGWERYASILAVGGPSQIIVPASKVQVSRRHIAFYFHNRADEPYMYGLGWTLAHCVNGAWLPVPFTSRVIHSIGISIAGGDTKLEMIHFYHIFGELPPGRYMFIRSHIPHSQIGISVRDEEYLLLEFVIDENTPASLDTEYVPWNARGPGWGESPPPPSPLPEYVQLLEYEFSPTGMEITIANRSAHDFAYFGPGTIRWYNHGLWESINILSAPALYRQGFPPGGTISISANWNERYGNLPPGKYQVTLNFVGGGALAPSIGHRLEIEFSITEETCDNTVISGTFEESMVVVSYSANPTGMYLTWENRSPREYYLRQQYDLFRLTDTGREFLGVIHIDHAIHYTDRVYPGGTVDVYVSWEDVHGIGSLPPGRYLIRQLFVYYTESLSLLTPSGRDLRGRNFYHAFELP